MLRKKKKNSITVALEEMEVGANIPAEDFEGGSEELEEITDELVGVAENDSEEVSQIDDEIDAAAIDGETLDNMQSIAQDSTEPTVEIDEETGEETVIEPEGLPPEAAAIAQEMLNNIMRRRKTTMRKATMPAIESFGAPGKTRLQATQISAEAIGFASTKIWDAVGNATEQSTQKFQEFIGSLDQSLEALSAQNADIKAKVNALRNAKPTEESVGGMSNVSQIFGLDGGNSVKQIAETFRSLEEYVAKAPSTVKAANQVMDQVEELLKDAEPVMGEEYYESLVQVIHTIGGDIDTGKTEDGGSYTSVTLSNLNKGYVDTISVTYDQASGSVKVSTSSQNPESEGVDALPVLSLKDIVSISNEANRSINALSGFTRVSGEIDKFNQQSHDFVKGLTKDYAGFSARFKEALKQGAIGAAGGAAVGAAGGAASGSVVSGIKSLKDKAYSNTSDHGPVKPLIGSSGKPAKSEFVGPVKPSFATKAASNVKDRINGLKDKAYSNTSDHGPVKPLVGSFSKAASNTSDHGPVKPNLAAKAVFNAKDRVNDLKNKAFSNTSDHGPVKPLIGSGAKANAAKGALVGGAIGAIGGAIRGFAQGKSGGYSVLMNNVRNVVLGLNTVNRVVSVTAPSGLLSAVSSAQKYCVKSLAAYAQE